MDLHNIQKPTEMDIYKASIEKALAAWRHEVDIKARSKSTFTRLTGLLGQSPICGVRASATEALVLATWRTVLREYDPKGAMSWSMQAAMLEGLLRYNRWRTFVDTSEDATVLITLVLRYTTKGSTNSLNITAFDVPSAGRLSPMIQRMLSEWLAPTLVTERTTLREIATVLFGDAWCTLVAEPGQGVPLAVLIESTRPQFLPGLITRAETVLPCPLPAMI
jgi:hypothetical protein